MVGTVVVETMVVAGSIVVAPAVVVGSIAAVAAQVFVAIVAVGFADMDLVIVALFIPLTTLHNTLSI